MLATYRHEVRRLVDAAGQLLQEQAPIDALRSWVERLARYAVTKHGLADALRKASTPGNDLSSTETYGAIVAALDRLLQANISAGTLRHLSSAQAEEQVCCDPRLRGPYRRRRGHWRGRTVRPTADAGRRAVC